MIRKSRFAAWQETNQVRREKILDEFLQKLGGTRASFRNPTDLAAVAAQHITKIENAPCDKSTLLRNVRYRAKLFSYHVSSSGRLRPRLSTDPNSEALVLAQKLEVANMRGEIERLKWYIETLEEKVNAKGAPPPQVSDGDAAIGNADQSVVSDFEYKFIRTCQALHSVLRHMHLVLEVDTAAERILDRSKLRNNVIVDKELAGSFVGWLRFQSGDHR